MDNRTLNIKAVQILLTANPSTNLSANKIINALIISKNKPKVTMVIGNVSITKSGLTQTFNNAKTMATIKAVVYVSTETPGSNFPSMIMATTLVTILIKNFIEMVLPL